MLARRLARELALEALEGHETGSSESDSGTVSSLGSLLCEQQVQRPPWLQQQLSAEQREKVRSQEPEEQSLDQSDATMLTLVTLERRPQVHALVRLLAAVALGVGRSRLAHGAAVLALRHGPALLVDVLEWSVCGVETDSLAFMVSIIPLCFVFFFAVPLSRPLFGLFFPFHFLSLFLIPFTPRRGVWGVRVQLRAAALHAKLGGRLSMRGKQGSREARKRALAPTKDEGLPRPCCRSFCSCPSIGVPAKTPPSPPKQPQQAASTMLAPAHRRPATAAIGKK